MGVKFSQLPEIAVEEVAAEDYIAVLDVSDGVLKKAPILHSSRNTAFGLGSPNYFGHVKVSDTYDSYVGDASEGISASQSAIYNAYNQCISLCLPTWVGTENDWNNLPDSTKDKYVIVNFTDV